MCHLLAIGDGILLGASHMGIVVTVYDKARGECDGALLGTRIAEIPPVTDHIAHEQV